MSSISPIATKEFAAEDQGARRRLSRCAGLGRRSRGQGGLADHHGRRLGRGLRRGQADVRKDGQEHHPGRRQWRRADHQGRQPDHRRAQYRGGRRGAAVRLQGGRRSRARAAGADGRLCRLAHPRGAWRAHGQAHLRSGLPHRIAPEGSQSRAAGRQGARRRAAQHRLGAAIVQRLRRRMAARHGIIRAWCARWRSWRITRSARRARKGEIDGWRSSGAAAAPCSRRRSTPPRRRFACRPICRPNPRGARSSSAPARPPPRWPPRSRRIGTARSKASSSRATAMARRPSASKSSRRAIRCRTKRGRRPPARFSNSSRASGRTISCSASFRAAARRCSLCLMARSRSPTNRRSIARCCAAARISAR